MSWDALLGCPLLGCPLWFALKADGAAANPTGLVREIYQFLQDHSESLQENQKLIAERFVDTYAKLEPEQLETLKREVNMKWMGNTITEYYTLLGEERGEKRGIALGEQRGIALGEERGEKRGLIQGELRALERMLLEGKIDQPYYDQASARLKVDLAELNHNGKVKRKPAPKSRSTS